MNPQDRPARRFDEPPAYEDLELRPEEQFLDELLAEFAGDPDIAARSHLGAIVIVAAVLVLVVVAAALFLRGAS
jgi:hypothetical protein